MEILADYFLEQCQKMNSNEVHIAFRPKFVTKGYDLITEFWGRKNGLARINSRFILPRDINYHLMLKPIIKARAPFFRRTLSGIYILNEDLNEHTSIKYSREKNYSSIDVSCGGPGTLTQRPLLDSGDFYLFLQNHTDIVNSVLSFAQRFSRDSVKMEVI